MPESQPPQFDPFSPWKPFQKAWMDAWSKSMGETLSSEEFAREMGQYLDQYLQASTPVRQQTEKALEQYLEQMNLPSRGEVTGLAERLANLELRVDDLDAKADEMLDLLKEIRAQLGASAARPRRKSRATAGKVEDNVRASPTAQP